MIITTTAWNTANAKMAKMPIYAFSIAGQATVYTTHDLVRCGITGSLPSYQAWLKTPQGNAQTADIVNGSSSMGTLQCEVLDAGGAIRTLVGTHTLEGSMVTLRVGYPGLAWSDFAVLATYLLYQINPSEGFNSFLFIARDLLFLEEITVYAHPENGYLIDENNPWYLCGTPAEIAQAVWLGALGMTAAQVDRAALLALDSPAENNFAPWRPFQFQLTKSFNAKSFLESEVFKPSGLYPLVLASGALSVRSMRPPAAGPSPVFTFSEANLVSFPQWTRQRVINQAVWQFDYDGSGYQNTNTFLEATSISQYTQGQQFSVTSQGLRTELGAFAYSEWVTSRLFRRFAGVAPGIKGGAPVLNIRAFLMSLPVWLGDYVALTHTTMPDITTGARGVTNRIYEVVDRQPDYAGGQMSYKLLDTGLTGAPAACTIGAGSANPWVIGTGAIY